MFVFLKNFFASILTVVFASLKQAFEKLFLRYFLITFVCAMNFQMDFSLNDIATLSINRDDHNGSFRKKKELVSWSNNSLITILDTSIIILNL